MIVGNYCQNELLTLIFIDLSFLNVERWYIKTASRVCLGLDRGITKFSFH